LRELARMVIVLTVISACSALVLSYANQSTKPQREYQLLKYVQEPSIQAVLSGLQYTNDPIMDRVVLEMGTNDKGNPITKTIFPAKKEGTLLAVAYDSTATGYNESVDIMVGVNMEGALTGVSVMTHSETPGLGARIQEAAFTNKFKNLELSPSLQLSAQGGRIDAISGATVSSRAVVTAVRDALEFFTKVKKEVSDS
jgi:Na+-translocating ferredoxin:NAD+ oxidoreductase subunit G